MSRCGGPVMNPGIPPSLVCLTCAALRVARATHSLSRFSVFILRWPGSRGKPATKETKQYWHLSGQGTALFRHRVHGSGICAVTEAPLSLALLPSGPG